MEKNRTVQRKSSKKRKKPKVRFNFWLMFIIFVISFTACFILYMLAANLNDDFFRDEFDGTSVQRTTDIPQTTDNMIATEPVSAADVSVTNPVPQSSPADENYFDSACLITDATLIQMSDKGKFSATNVFGSTELNASNCTTTKIDSTFGNASVYDIIKDKKPSVLYIMLGSDLGTSSADTMISNYTALVNNLHSALPDMKIYVMQIPPVIYDTETLTNDMINEYNNRLLAMCNTVGVYCIDTNTALKAENGTLSEDYWSYETLTLSAVGYEKICEYILTHIA